MGPALQKTVGRHPCVPPHTALLAKNPVIAKPVRTLAVGSDPSAAGGGRSEVSEWPRSKFQASAVRQRRNFGHRNRVILIPSRRTSCFAPGVVLSANSGRKCPKSAVKTHGFEILSAPGMHPVWTPSATRTIRSSLPPCFRIVSAPTSAGRSRGPALPWHNRDALCVYRPAHNVSCWTSEGPRPTSARPDLHRTHYHAPVGRGALTPPPGLALHSLQKTCHCEAGAHTGCGNPFSLRRTIFISRRRTWHPNSAPAIFDT